MRGRRELHWKESMKKFTLEIEENKITLKRHEEGDIITLEKQKKENYIWKRGRSGLHSKDNKKKIILEKEKIDSYIENLFFKYIYYFIIIKISLRSNINFLKLN